MNKELNKAIEAIKEIADPDKIILFGSHAKGKSNFDSDIDLLVLKRGVKNRRELAQKIYLNFTDIGAPVDVIVEDPVEFEIKKKDPFLIYKEISESGKVVYERN
ncbi:MAG: nucleotidyltransferase domain-containing protein [Ignavibacteriales bacterium]|nr:nucleotidyltransferase domain-containing protein [Ignavibacteriales bacterium]